VNDTRTHTAARTDPLTAYAAAAAAAATAAMQRTRCHVVRTGLSRSQAFVTGHTNEYHALQQHSNGSP